MSDFNSQHPRVPAGSEKGGEFTVKTGGGSSPTLSKGDWSLETTTAEIAKDLTSKGIKVDLSGFQRFSPAQQTAVKTSLESLSRANELYRKAGGLPRIEVKFTSDPLEQGEAYAKGSTLNVNLGAVSWRDQKVGNESMLAYRSRSEYERKEQSTSNPDHTMIHELAHIEHRMKLGADRYRNLGFKSPKEKSLAKRVSTYASKDAVEFVAETRTALLSGIKVSPQVMALYVELGGTQ